MSSPSPDPDLYAVLGVAPDADPAAIRTAYRRRAREAHPDRGGTDEQFQHVQHAWEVLGSAEARADYDRRRSRAGGAGPAEDVPSWTAPTAAGAARGAERATPSGAAHRAVVYEPELSSPQPLSLPLTSQKVHGEFASRGLFVGGRALRRRRRTVELLERQVLAELPAARLFNDVHLLPPRPDRRGRARPPKQGERAEHVLVCGDALVVVFSLEVPASVASWDGTTLRAAGRAITLPDLAGQAAQLQETLFRRLADEHGRRAELTVGHQVILHSPDGGLLSPVVETLRPGGRAPLAAGRAVRAITGQLAISSRANVVDRALLSVLRGQLASPVTR
ncbi:hypothetical protein GCM10027060_19830 [Nesterenkonia halophila]|uniref:J domain-containing protein n=1 Tax=Nesterenkonia halophila TaxID=302044 RepID=UPI001291D606|nr:J domain-containing protein [Nesterenkonia halophila]